MLWAASAILVLLVLLFLEASSYDELVLEVEDCRDRGECFSGAWLTLATHVQDAPMMSLYFNHYSQIFLKGKRRITCEEASYFLFHKVQKRNRIKQMEKELLSENNITTHQSNYIQSRTQDQLKKWGDYPRQSIDLLDFSVLHLSVAERLLSRSPLLDHRVKIEVQEMIATLRNTFQSRNSKINAKLANPSSKHFTKLQSKLDETLVLVPVILRRKGRGGSATTYREQYLELTLQSLSMYFKHIVVSVLYEEDRDRLLSLKSTLKRQDMPVWDIMYLGDLAGANENHNGFGTSCQLPLATIVEATRRVLNENAYSSFKYVYFTEADQILVTRDMHRLYKYVEEYPRSVLVPHRLVVTPPAFLASQNRTMDTSTQVFTSQLPSSSRVRKFSNKRSRNNRISASTLFQTSCCLDTHGYGLTRIHWKGIRDNATQLINVHGVVAVAGNANFPSQIYRTCNVTRSLMKCPPSNPVSHQYSDDPFNEIYAKN